ncbi:MAG: DUF2975 domain-containing protein [Emergencia sp.]
MNTTTVKRINKFGRVGKIVTVVLIVIMLIGTAAAAAGSVFLSRLPEDAVSVKVAGRAEIRADENFFQKYFGLFTDGFSYSTDELSEEDLENDMTALPDEGRVDMKMSVNGAEFSKAVMRSEDGKKILEAETGEYEYRIKDLIIVLVSAILLMLSAAAALFFLRKLFACIETCETPFSEDIVKALQRFTVSLVPVAVISSAAETLSNSLLIPGAGLDIKLDGGMIIACIVAFCLGTVFRYGAQLQKESDETL